MREEQQRPIEGTPVVICAIPDAYTGVLVRDDGAIAIDLADLRAALGRLLDAATDRFGPTLLLEADHYWTLNVADRFNLAREPAVEAGQLSDDVAEVHELLARAEGEVFLWHDLEHVVGILQRIADLDLPHVKAARRPLA